MAKKIDTKGVRARWMNVRELGLRYEWGGKLKMLLKPAPVRYGVDCSGLTRDVVWFGTDIKQMPPDGSVAQREFCEEQGFERVDYSEALKDTTNRVFWCFYDNNNGRDRHTWLLQNGHTLESRSGQGTKSRPGATAVLAKNVQACFALS